MTLSEVERVALSQGLHPDDLLAGYFPEEPPRPEALGRLFGKEDALEVQVAWRLWCARLALEVAEASRILQHYLDRFGLPVEERGGGISLHRVAAELEPADYRAFWYEMPVRQALVWLGLRGLNEYDRKLRNG